jgi:flavin reductase (DIM6/NTAB) family NADH-FMN oxidoreductase RutF
MSVSLHPKLVVVSISEKAQMLKYIKKSNKYAVNILSADQQVLSMVFAGQTNEKKKVSFNTLNDMPVIQGALAQITCEVVNKHVEGDHTLFIGKVTNIHLEDHEPLLLFNGQYRSLLAQEVPLEK